LSFSLCLLLCFENAHRHLSEQKARGRPRFFTGVIAFPHHGQNCFAQAAMNSSMSGSSYACCMISSRPRNSGVSTKLSAAGL